MPAGPVYDQARGFDTNQTATAVKIDTGDRAHVTAVLEGPQGGDYEIQISADDSNWYTHTSHSAATTDQVDNFEIGVRYVRYEITTASGSGGETGNFLLSASD